MIWWGKGGRSVQGKLFLYTIKEYSLLFKEIGKAVSKLRVTAYLTGLQGLTVQQAMIKPGKVLQGILRVRGVDFGGCWTPLFSSANHQQGGVTHWPVAVTKAELYCIVCGANGLPTVQPRPILTRQVLALAKRDCLLKPFKAGTI